MYLDEPTENYVEKAIDTVFEINKNVSQQHTIHLLSNSLTGEIRRHIGVFDRKRRDRIMRSRDRNTVDSSKQL